MSRQALNFIGRLRRLEQEELERKSRPQKSLERFIEA